MDNLERRCCCVRAETVLLRVMLRIVVHHNTNVMEWKLMKGDFNLLIHCLATTTQSQRKHKGEQRCQSKQPDDIVRQELLIAMETDEGRLQVFFDPLSCYDNTKLKKAQRRTTLPIKATWRYCSTRIANCNGNWWSVPRSHETARAHRCQACCMLHIACLAVAHFQLLCTNSHLLDLIVILQTLSSCSRK